MLVDDVVMVFWMPAIQEAVLALALVDKVPIAIVAGNTHTPVVKSTVRIPKTELVAVTLVTMFKLENCNRKLDVALTSLTTATIC